MNICPRKWPIALLILLGVGLNTVAGLAHAGDLRAATQNPISSMISLPFKFTFDNGADNGDANILTVQPVIPVTVGDWNLVNRAIIPYMLQQNNGKIVSIAARAALSGKANMAPYVISKSAVVRLTESMAAEMHDHNINVNCILPGTIDTPRNREENPDADFNKWVSPQAIADVILFLSSSAARAINGASIPIYGRS